MTSPNKIIKNADLVINNGKISSINGVIPKKAKVINGENKWLIPGLIDIHIHLPTDLNLKSKTLTQKPDISFDVQDLMTPFIANGVTTILNLNANVQSFYQRKQISNGDIIGPRMAIAALIDGGNGNGKTANTPEEGRLIVRIAKDDGYEFIKLYSGLNVETYKAIIEEANKQGMKTVGHIPNVFQNDIEKAFIPHFNLVAHAEEFSKSARKFDYQEALNFAKIAKENDTWVSPTLTAMDWIASQTSSLTRLETSTSTQFVHPLLQSKWLTANSYYKKSTPERITYFKQFLEFQMLLVKAFKEVNVPILVGTDAGVSGVVPGFSLHDELELLVQAGLSTEEALDSATRLNALWLGIDKEVGTIEENKLADLVLLDENPLININNTRKIVGVFINGVWLDKKTFEKMLLDLSIKNTELKDEFDWNTLMTNKK
ncbi:MULTISPECIES: amidohydrolase family protein [unclassified Flavobacterium]|nr:MULTISPECIES: amidohydrolase family protein [unclassified Flavobacterium]